MNAAHNVNDLDRFRADVSAWLAANMKPARHGLPGGFVSADAVTRARELQQRLHAGGYAGLSMPAEYGGRGLTVDHEQVLTEEGRAFEMPTLCEVPTTRIIMPAILAHATEEQKRRHIPAMLDGRELWVQLLSEPSGGSDLAGLRTRATRDGERYVLEGQKVWSTGAQFVDYGLALARTNWDVPKHRGLTAFIVPFDLDGITVAPIKQITGESDFCEVFFDEVQVPIENIVGEIDQGWTVALTILAHERRSAGAGHMGDASVDLRALAKRVDRLDDPTVQRQIADAHVRSLIEMEMLHQITESIAMGRLPQPAGALLKLFRSDKTQRAARAAAHIAGQGGVVWPTDADADHGDRWSREYLQSRARSVAGGTNEMQRNVIGERVLGLPREPQFDKDVPFRDVGRH